jgi:hypothetical protein
MEKAIQRFIHPTPQRPQHSPYAWVVAPSNYGAKVQYTTPDDSTPALDKQGIKRLQQEVIGAFLFSARAVDNTMLIALGTLATAQTKGSTEKTMDYTATHPGSICFHKPQK